MTELLSYPLTDQGVAEALKALGTSHTAVARNLDAMGFKGCRDKSGRCPVANYLLAVITGAVLVSVIRGDATVWSVRDATRANARMTDAVADFVEFFDLGRYPQLEEPDGSS